MTRKIPWGVARHVWPGPDGDLDRDLALIQELGAKLIRTDFWWYAIEPERGRIDQDALASYSTTIDKAAARGLSVIVILSGAPDWARALYTQDRNAFFASFESYAAAISQMAGARVRYYQLWNEPNHILDFVDGEGDVRLFEHGRRGLASGTFHPITTMINVLVDGHDSPIAPNWMSDVDFYMHRSAARNAIDVIGIDHYPGTWSFGDWGGNLMDRLGALGKRWGKSVAVLETGYSTPACSMPFNTEAAQASWIDTQLPRLKAKARAIEQRDGVKVELLNWFKLDDRPQDNCFNPEDHFGIVHTNRTKKPAFESLKTQITH